MDLDWLFGHVMLTLWPNLTSYFLATFSFILLNIKNTNIDLRIINNITKITLLNSYKIYRTVKITIK